MPKYMQFPNSSSINPYLDLFAASVARYGWERVPHSVLPGSPDNLQRTLQKLAGIELIHLHWFQKLYLRRSYEDTLSSLNSLMEALDEAIANGTRVTWTVHNIEPHESPWPNLDRLAARMLAGRAHAAFVDSAHGASACTVALPELSGKVVVAPSGSNRSVYDRAWEEHGRPDFQFTTHHRIGSEVYLAFGNARRYKQFATVANVFADHDSLEDAVLVIAGELEDCQDDLLLVAKRSPRIMLYPREVPNKLVAPLMRQSSFLICHYSAFFNSGAQLLAAAYGTPSLIRPLGTAADCPAQGRVDISDNTPEALAEALSRSRKVDRATMSSSAFAWASGRSWSTLGRIVAKRWDSII